MTGDSNSLIERIEQEIENNLTSEQFGVEELANSLGISRSHLHRKVKTATEKSVSQFIREYRLEKAKKLLTETDLNVSEIAYQVGFGSATYFSKSFMDYFGYSPRQSRKGKDAPTPATKSKIRIKAIFAGIVVLALVLAFTAFRWWQNGNSERILFKKSIAIVPFENLSKNQENQYYTEGVSDAISRQLSNSTDLRIISRNSVHSFSQGNLNLKAISKEFKAGYVLEGSVQKFKNTFRLEVRLIDPETNTDVWAKNYDRDSEDILKIQNEIALNIASALEAEISSTTLKKDYTVNSEAYELYLEAVYEFNTYSRKGLMLSEEYLLKAIEIDSTFALAYAFYGQSQFAKAAMFAAEEDALTALGNAIEPINKALALDPKLPEAHSSKGFYYLYHDWDFKAAEKEYKKGLAVGNPVGFALYIDYLNFVRNHKEALYYTNEMEKIAPYYPNSRKILSSYYNGNILEGKAFAASRLKVMNNYYLRDSYGFLLLNNKEYDEAIEVFKDLFELEGIRYPRILGWLGAALAKSGREEEARAIIKELLERREISKAGSKGFFIAVVYSALGEKEEAIDWLKTAVKDHEMEIPWLISEPQFFNLHEEKAFQDLVQSIGFPNQFPPK
ncbi:helix-turn-helix domain-containing protein [Arcticibacterium luteifluviistationis]|uniref:HTH araC/xylS-type domain-containing protein n=1 Tax=Arcticibacterium luteifluviistationis TaxID=1784714 RepID=A0A2Z4G714_9BACT|nr:helix-turn-helix domain-containing protein [Arcticibacterium luteifluviistationis]AWV96935.1 hypothetical protein DJ013_01585 [Arcticibacterium luteifluviistationis]